MIVLAALAEAAIDPAPTHANVSVAAGVEGGRDVRPSRAHTTRTAAAASIIPPRWRAYATCIVHRESHDNPRARNPHSSAQGIAQWLDAWRHGLAHDIAVRLHQFGMPWPEARAVRNWLRGKDIATWPRTLQETGLAATLDAGNWRPWYLAGSKCNGLVPR